jgi:hypothetical protein
MRVIIGIDGGGTTGRLRLELTGPGEKHIAVAGAMSWAMRGALMIWDDGA